MKDHAAQTRYGMRIDVPHAHTESFHGDNHGHGEGSHHTGPYGSSSDHGYYCESENGGTYSYGHGNVHGCGNDPCGFYFGSGRSLGCVSEDGHER